MARVTSLPATSLPRRVAYGVARRMFGGKVPEPIAVQAHAGGVFWSTSIFESLVMRTWKRTPQRLADIVTLRASVVIGCPWCIDFGSHEARRSLSEQELRAIGSYETSDLFSPLEQEVMAYADAITATPMTTTDEMVASLVGQLGEPVVVEITALAALENQRSRFNHAMGITAQGFTSGAACAVPVATR